MKIATVQEFFNLAMQSQINELDAENIIEDLTSGYQIHKLELLLKDLRFLRFYDNEEFERDCIDLLNNQEYLNKNEIEIKLKKIEIITNGESVFVETIDYVKTFDPYRYYSINIIIGRVENIIKNEQELISTSKEVSKAENIEDSSMKAEFEITKINPNLIPEARLLVFDILKDFFSLEHHAELKQILETGKNSSIKLLFKDNGNRLTDTFKKLIEHDFIKGCQKKDLINWIISNFNFTNNGKIKTFVYDTVEKTIARKYYPCKSPVIEIKNGQIQKVEQPRIKKYSKY